MKLRSEFKQLSRGGKKYLRRRKAALRRVMKPGPAFDEALHALAAQFFRK